MKFRLIFAAPVVLSLLAAGCSQKYTTIENGLYINEAAPSGQFHQQVESLVVRGETTVDIHLRLARPLDSDVHAVLAMAPELVDEYNSVNNANYAPLPEEYVDFTPEVVIPAGSISSDPVAIRISEFPTGDGQAYCIPLKIASNDADVRIMEASGHILYLITTPLRQVVPTMDSSTFPETAGDWNVATSEWTLEAWVWMSAFSINNQAIFNAPVSKGTEIYVRFGDADVPYDKLQIKTYGSQFNSNATFEPETWYHLAFVCANNKCTMYINGQEDSSMEISGNDYVIDNLQLCSSGSYFRAQCKMAQVRFWSKALAATAIRDAMNREVPASSEGLIGYWKLNEGSGDVYRDSSPNGRDMHCDNAPVWTSYEIDFTDPNASAEQE